MKIKVTSAFIASLILLAACGSQAKESAENINTAPVSSFTEITSEANLEEAAEPPLVEEVVPVSSLPPVTCDPENNTSNANLNPCWYDPNLAPKS